MSPSEGYTVGIRMPFGGFARRLAIPFDPETAERALTDAVRVDSSEIEAYLALCGFYRSRGEIGRAIRLHQNLLLRKDLDARERAPLIEPVPQLLDGAALAKSQRKRDLVVCLAPNPDIA